MSASEEIRRVLDHYKYPTQPMLDAFRAEVLREDESLPPQLRDALRRMAKRGPVIELTAAAAESTNDRIDGTGALRAEVARLQKLVDAGSVEVGSSNGQWEHWRRQYERAANVRWDDELPPGGEVCADPECGQPVESEPCPEHSPQAVIARLTAERDQARGIAVQLENENARVLAEPRAAARTEGGGADA